MVRLREQVKRLYPVQGISVLLELCDIPRQRRGIAGNIDYVRVCQALPDILFRVSSRSGAGRLKPHRMSVSMCCRLPGHLLSSAGSMLLLQACFSRVKSGIQDGSRFNFDRSDSIAEAASGTVKFPRSSMKLENFGITRKFFDGFHYICDETDVLRPVHLDEYAGRNRRHSLVSAFAPGRSI